jgi:hypothetical protein
MESPTSSTNIDISRFLTTTENLEVARSTLENKCADPLLLKMLEEGLHADITLNAQGGTVKAHRSVLASASPVFQAMFQHDMKEHLTSTVDLLYITIDSLQLFLLLLYITNERTKKMVELNAAVDLHFDELYDTADRFEVARRLNVVLIAALGRNLTPRNCWNYMHKSNDSLLSEHGAMRVCFDYVKQNFKEVVKSESTILEMRENPDRVHSYIEIAMKEGVFGGKFEDAPSQRMTWPHWRNRN